MPNIASAAKRLRQNVKRQMFNRMRKSRVKTAETNYYFILGKQNEEAAVAEFVAKFFPAELKKATEAGQKLGGKEAVALALSKCFSELDKAVKVGVIHKNKANRKKSRLTAKEGIKG